MTGSMKEGLNTMRQRLNSHPLIALFVIFVLFHAVTQISLQIAAFSLNFHGASLLLKINEVQQQQEQTVSSPDILTAGQMSTSAAATASSYPRSLNPISAGLLVANSTPHVSEARATSTSRAVAHAPSRTASMTPSVNTRRLNLPPRMIRASASILSRSATRDLTGRSASGHLSEMASLHRRRSTSNHRLWVKRTEEPIAVEQAEANATVLQLAKYDSSGYGAERSTNNAAIVVSGLGRNGNGRVLLNDECLESLELPSNFLRHSFVEDLAFIVFQLWVMILALSGIYYESVPHLIAVFLSHACSESFAIFQTTQTVFFRRLFNGIAGNGSCNVQLLQILVPDYWIKVLSIEVTVCVVQGVISIAMLVLAYKLHSVFGWRTFKRLGASISVSAAHRNALIFSITILLSVYFVFAFHAVWLEELCVDPWQAGPSGSVQLTTWYKGILAALAVLALPWTLTGWIALKTESKRLMMGFVAMGLLYIVNGAFIASQQIFFSSSGGGWKFTYFLAAVAGVSVTSNLVMGVLCVSAFGKGLFTDSSEDGTAGIQSGREDLETEGGNTNEKEEEEKVWTLDEHAGGQWSEDDFVATYEKAVHSLPPSPQLLAFTTDAPRGATTTTATTTHHRTGSQSSTISTFTATSSNTTLCSSPAHQGRRQRADSNPASRPRLVLD